MTSNETQTMIHKECLFCDTVQPTRWLVFSRPSFVLRFIYNRVSTMLSRRVWLCLVLLLVLLLVLVVTGQYCVPFKTELCCEREWCEVLSITQSKILTLTPTPFLCHCYTSHHHFSPDLPHLVPSDFFRSTPIRVLWHIIGKFYWIEK